VTTVITVTEEEIRKSVPGHQRQREALQELRTQLVQMRTDINNLNESNDRDNTEPQLLLLEQQVEQLPSDNVDAMRLKDQVSKARDSQQAYELLSANLKNELNALQRQADDIDANIRPHLDGIPTSKAGKKKKSKHAQKSFDIDQQIVDIRRATDDLNNDLIPKLGDLQRMADLNNVSIDAAAPLQDHLLRLIDEYQVGFK
jgi:DNA repair exonuclease SbcCD ATPase subunit